MIEGLIDFGELERIRQLEKGTLTKAKRIRKQALLNYFIDTSEIDLSEYLEVEELKKLYLPIPSKDRVNTKQTKLNEVKKWQTNKTKQ